MSNRQARGDRRTKSEVFDRCYALLVRLLRGSATGAELLEIIDSKAQEYGEDLPRNAARKRFEEDRRRLREWFYAEIEYERGYDAYTLTDIHRPLIDLPTDALRGLAFLKATFKDDESVMRAEVSALIDFVQRLLPNDRQRDLDRERGLIEVSLQPRDEDSIPDGLLEKLSYVCNQRQQLEFDYLAASNQDDIPRTHLVEPLRCYFNEEKGHYYLQAFNLETRGPNGRHTQSEVRDYRIGRISNPCVLPTHFPENKRRLPRYELIYELTPRVARRGVTTHFPESVVYQQPDGGAIVHAVSLNLFNDLRRLLHYGSNCRVTGGKEAVKEMRAIVSALHQRYQEKSITSEL